MTILSANITAVRSLIEYLSLLMPSFDKDSNILEEWPEANRDMEYPIMSVISKPEKFTPHPSNVLSTTDIVGGDNDGKLSVIYNTGQYDIGIQIDIWCDNKEKRGELYQEFIDAFNNQFITEDLPMGVSATLVDYYNSIARYDMIGYNYPSDGNSSQIGEWRVKIDLTSNFRSLKEVVRNKMTNIVLQDEISTTVEIN